MAGPPRPFINNLQITVKQKMAVHRSECEPRLGLASFLSQRSIPMKNVMCHWCNCVCVCVYCVSTLLKLHLCETTETNVVI